MKSVIINEDEIIDKKTIIGKLFYDSNDPRSINYKRKLIRPKINWIKVFAFFLIPIVLLAVLTFLLNKAGLGIKRSTLISALLFLIYLVVMIKPAAIYMIKIYQRYAPERIRNKCRFEPSCSEYMILVIEKYGLFKGLKMGINRLKRCNIDNGGYDYPA